MEKATRQSAQVEVYCSEEYFPEHVATDLDDLASLGLSIFPGASDPITLENIKEMACLLEGYTYRLNYGPIPPVAFNQNTPSAKALRVDGGSNCRMSWEIGWAKANKAIQKIQLEKYHY